jgi:hypothetical protein
MLPAIGLQREIPVCRRYSKIPSMKHVSLRDRGTGNRVELPDGRKFDLSSEEHFNKEIRDDFPDHTLSFLW